MPNELTGGLNNYYVVPIEHPQREGQDPYNAECEDIIQALGMTFDEGCAFKAIWRSAAARLGNGKKDHKALYDAEKLVHYSGRILRKAQFADSKPTDRELYNMLELQREMQARTSQIKRAP